MRILAIDQGTTSSRAVIVDSAARVIGAGQLEFTQHYPRPGWVEHDPDEIWRTTAEAIRRALTAAGCGASDITAIGIATQRETVVAWDRRTGEPLAPATVWQDRRTAGDCAALRAAGHEEAVQALTGLTLDPYFSATKMAWLVRNDTAVADAATDGRLALGTIDSWLIWKFSAGRRHCTDVTNASRTMLFDIHRGAWSDELCELFGVPAAALPEVVPSSGPLATVDEGVFGAKVPVTGIAGDQQAALFGQACFAPGMAKNTYGTGCFLLAHSGGTPAVSGHRLLTTAAATAGGTPAFALEGSVFVAGALVQWLRDRLGLIGLPPPRSRRWPRRCPTRAASRSCRRSPGSAPRTGIPRRAAPSSG